jgi:glycosyltransferase involved in cell wall biosynthesis
MPGTILLISQVFPPDSIVGALRAGNVARAFRDAGYSVIVVTAAMEGERPGLRQWERGVSVHTVPVGDRYRDRLTRLLRRLQSLLPFRGAAADQRATESYTSSDARPAGGALRTLLLSLVWIPDDELRFVLPAYRAARRLLREGVDLVYTSAPSHSTNLAGLLLKRIHGIRWCAEFRDPWCYPHSFPATPLVERVNEYLERRCIKAADHLVTVTDQAADLYRRRLGRSADKVIVVRNGIPAILRRAERREGDPFRIVYSGTIYGRRNPQSFLRAAAAVSREYADAGPQLAIDMFVGNGQAADVTPLDAWITEHGMTSKVCLHDWVSHSDLQQLLRQADLLLLLAQQQPLQVPNKLYEYLGTGVPILAIADAHGETARMLRQVGGHYVVADDSVSGIAAALRDAIRRRDHPSSREPQGVPEDWLTERQMRLLVAAVGPRPTSRSRVAAKDVPTRA